MSAVDRGPAPPQYVGRFGGWGGRGRSRRRRVALSGPVRGVPGGRGRLAVCRRPGEPRRPRGPAAGRPAAEARSERPHPCALLDPRRAAASVHGRRPDRAAVRRDDRRDRRGRASGGRPDASARSPSPIPSSPRTTSVGSGPAAAGSFSRGRVECGEHVRSCPRPDRTLARSRSAPRGDGARRTSPSRPRRRSR